MADPTPRDPLPYQACYEHVEEDETETIAELETIFVGMAGTVAQANGHAVRAVHAKGHGLLRARLEVPGGLPPHLAQGIFAMAASYEALLRFSSPPAEQLPDAVSTPRAVALKVLGVPGERLDGAPGQATQDFLMVNGPAFARPGPKGFVKDARLLALTTEKAPGGKKALSKLLRGAEAALEAVGLESAKLKGLGGQPQVHPLGETYFSQVPFLFGPFMAKFSLAPASQSLLALKDSPLGDSDDAQRNALIDFFAPGGGAPAEWELQVQLCTDIDRMPIEDASVEWSQDLSPYVTVARLVVESQVAWDAALTPALDDSLGFDPWHAVTAHRPLGAVNRARKVVLAASRRHRSAFNGCPIHEPPASAGHRP